MPRKSNPYGYTIVENAYTHPIIRWDATTPHMELHPASKKQPQATASTTR